MEHGVVNVSLFCVDVVNVQRLPSCRHQLNSQSTDNCLQLVALKTHDNNGNFHICILLVFFSTAKSFLIAATVT